jgi:Recombinase zinc beta ribbon domain
MATNFITPRKTGYYRCGKRYRAGKHACSQGKNIRAEETEAAVWGFVSRILKDPERLRRGIDEMLDRERALTSRSPGNDEEGWLKKLSELETQEELLLYLYLEGKLEIGRYESRISQFKQSRRTIEAELERIRNHAAHIEHLEHDRNALVSHYSRITADHLDELEPQERNRVYKMLGLTVLAHGDGSLEAKWALGADPCRDNEPLLRWSSTFTTHSIRFRALLTESDPQVLLYCG